MDVYEAESPDLAILDFNMPQRNGFDVTKAIRAMEATGEHLPVMILSATVTPEAREAARRAGADDFFGKPYESAALLQAIDRMARRAARPPARGGDERATSAVVTHLAPLVDFKRLAEVGKIAGDNDFLARLLSGFHDDVLRLLGRLASATSERKFSDIEDITHAVKGAALSVGASQLALLCDGINAAAAGGRVDSLHSQIENMRSCFERTVAEFEAYSSRNISVSL